MEEKDEQFLTGLENYLKVGLHIGTNFRNKYMEPFIYKVRSDGLSVMNVQKIDERIKLAAKFLAKFDPKDILIVCRRENGWKAVKMFAKITGVKCLTGRYPPGIMTNPNLEDFIETKLLFVIDPLIDINAVNDALNVGGIPIIGLCNTNNEATKLDLVIPCNNKGKQSLGMLFWILANEFLKQKGILKENVEMGYKPEDFFSEEA